VILWYSVGHVVHAYLQCVHLLHHICYDSAMAHMYSYCCHCHCYCIACVYRNATALLQPPLAEGDTVKVELGCHVDGYVAVVAHTIKVCTLNHYQKLHTLLLPFCARHFFDAIAIIHFCISTCNIYCDVVTSHLPPVSSVVLSVVIHLTCSSACVLQAALLMHSALYTCRCCCVRLV
jgi:hypothetical protein